MERRRGVRQREEKKPMGVDGSGKKDRKRASGSAREEGCATEMCPVTEMKREGPEEARACCFGEQLRSGCPVLEDLELRKRVVGFGILHSDMLKKLTC
ncbi:hypothetical protein E2562_014722 [Oryza meyeriana var. granulata]|uniref:Uncharacterized protein n=1 Tax=Oryza meyeriana var. granulata TaxID=110450 RepID=A0A6G1BJH0_9ORYZ|nr:hypothetical protein E2562_014722 [Oryza meyeriana var. granulata]